MLTVKEERQEYRIRVKKEENIGEEEVSGLGKENEKCEINEHGKKELVRKSRCQFNGLKR